jgi:hypothetical protein
MARISQSYPKSRQVRCGSRGLGHSRSRLLGRLSEHKRRERERCRERKNRIIQANAYFEDSHDLLTFVSPDVTPELRLDEKSLILQ